MRGLYQSNLTITREHVGAGGGLVHLPGEVDDELRQINAEIMQFGGEIMASLFFTPRELTEAQSQRIAKMTDAEIAQTWPGETRASALRKLERDGVGAAGQVPRPGVNPEVLVWYRFAFRPFMDAWLPFFTDHIHIGMQNLPGSGAWDHAQETRATLIKLRDTARTMGIKLVTPDPREPKFDPNVVDKLGDAAKNLGSIVKYVLIGGLAIGGVVLLTSVFHDVKNNQAPADRFERYLGRGSKK